MIRALDVAAALQARGYERDGHVVIALGDRTLRLDVRAGRATASEGPSDAAHTLHTDVRTLTSLAFGGLTVRGAVQLDLARGEDAAGILTSPPFTTLDRF